MGVSGFDPSTDFETVADGLEAVTLNRRGSSSNVAVAKALQRAVTTSEVAASDGQYTQGDVRWHLPVSDDLPIAEPPSIGDSIVDAAGDDWVIMAVQDATLSSRWRCVSRNVVVQYGLDDRITIEVAAFAKGTGGAAERTWSVYRQVRANIIETTADTEVREGASRTAKQYDIVLAVDTEIGHQHRIRDEKGKLYTVVGSTGQDDVELLQTIQATEWRQT